MGADTPTASTLEEANAIIASLARDNERLSQQLSLLLNRVYGRSSEKINPDQLSLFEHGDGTKDRVVPASKPAKKSKKGHGRAAFPEHLDRVEVTCDVAESERICTTCGEQMAAIGSDTCERGHVVPAQIQVIRYQKLKYACPKGHEVKTGEAPAALIDRCKYEPSVFAQIATAKYADHLPLTRQESIWKRRGMPIAKSTMWDMILRVHELAAEPIMKQMRSEVLASRVVHADETPITVLVDGQKGQKTGYVWTYAAKNRVVFDFTMSRGRDGPRRFLGDFDGVLVADAYAGYDEVERQNGLTRVGCWSHARRRFKEARDAQGPIADEALYLIARLYRIESRIDEVAEERGLDEAARRELRAEARRRFSRRVLRRIDRVLAELEQRRDVLPKSVLGKAVAYAAGQWERLVRFVDDPDIPLDNNAAERALRPVALGRKNWLFAGSERGARCAASLYSLMASCKALDIDPAAYLEDVLRRIGSTPASDVASLTPWAWAANQQSS